jgi:putative sterol carrier protein
MTAKFPSPEWLEALADKLNSDARYAEIARKWEGDLCIVVEPSGPLKEQQNYYLDLWHGTCYDNITKILTGALDPMQAMMTRKLRVHGNMAVMMRSVPTVLDFVRCAREVTTEILS